MNIFYLVYRHQAVPKSLGGLTIPFEFNNEKDFKQKFKKSLKNLSCVGFRTCQKISL